MALIVEQKQVKQQPKKIKTSDKTCSVPTIPDEIIVNILSRLPVKVLLRYKSVCKLWCSLISDSYLIKSHLSLSASNPHSAHHQLILTISSFNINLLSCGLYEVMCDHKSVNVLELDHPFTIVEGFDDQYHNVLELDHPFTIVEGFDDQYHNVLELDHPFPIVEGFDDQYHNVLELDHPFPIVEGFDDQYHNVLELDHPFPIVEGFDDQYHNVLELDHPFPIVEGFDDQYHNVLELDSEVIVGSCNGLLCVAIARDTLYIWNPSTRKSNKLPYRGVKVSHGWSVMYGFGYDESNDDYKVVEVYYNKETDMYDTEVKIYSLKSGFWRKVGKFPCSPRRSRGAFGMFLNGALHWGITKPYGSSSLWTIVSLDLAKETFNEILQPAYDDSKYLAPSDTSRGFSLGVLGGWLCVLRDYLGRHADVWVMKVYGVKDSWTRLVSIPNMTSTAMQPRYSTPLYISNGGKVLLRLGSKWVMYDSKNSSFSDIQKFDGCLGAYTFIESLVSPYALEHKDDNVN